MTVILYTEEIRYDYYSRGDTGYALRVRLSQMPYHETAEGSYKVVNGDYLFGVPCDWSREKALSFGNALKKAAYDCTWGDASHYTNLRDGVDKMIREHLSEIYRRFCDPDT